MGSDNNCNNYYNGDQNSIVNMSSTPYYQTLSSQSNSSQEQMTKITNNECINSEQNSDVISSSQNQEQDSDSQIDQNSRCNGEMSNSRSQKSYHQSSQHHLPMSAPHWSFPSSLGHSYQRFYGDNHYGIVIAPNVPQQSSLISTSSSSLHSLNNEIQSQNHNHHVHQMQTNQHLKKIYYQGLKFVYL